ncbi:hypothetical protein E1263_04280 [Kribbella antibiotica]|uniref:Uncharacterized protein n=1 Tax=Kribbella antibiotica TaxID=190195 RepID=A0A4R4ZWC0_9ACTN|nr:hypothetical protein [Kribbella antibiotica]TDD62379.1 hypothetical protein E1263_04280 [Kribbella antibiotica]
MSTGGVDPEWTLPRRFWLIQRYGDQPVAEGVVWSGGQVTLHRPACSGWSGLWASLDRMLACQGDTVAVAWVDDGDDIHRECVEYYDGAVWIH